MVFTKEKIGCEKNKKEQKHVYHGPGALERTPYAFTALDNIRLALWIALS